MPDFRIETERLILRDWRDEDVDPFHAMSNDPRVMATLGPLMARADTEALVQRIKTIREDHGHTFWALERRADGAFIGWCGLIRASVAPILSKAEIGWRLAHDAWGQGYATEAAAASLDWGFAHLPDSRIWAITSLGNERSWGLMERLGMVRHPELNFDHPRISAGDPLRPHITYSIGREQWRA